MRCVDCGGTYQKIIDKYDHFDPIAGKISISNIPYYKCDKNAEILFTPEMAEALDTARNQKIHELLNGYPISDFLSASSTAGILGVSRQALHKNKRIRHGFIFHTAFDGVTVYLKQSVLQYKKTGDGRFPLISKGESSVNRSNAPLLVHDKPLA